MTEWEVAELKREIKLLLIETAQLPDITPEDIDDGAPLFVEGLGLDSIDSLAIILAIQNKYSVMINDQNLAKFILQSVNTIAEFVQKERGKSE